MTYLQMTTISAAFVFGMVLALLGSLKLALAKRLNLGEGRVAGLLAALNAAVIPMMVLTGWLIDGFGVQPVLILGSLTTAGGVLSLSLKPTYGRAFVSVLAAGLGASALSTAAVVLMPPAFKDLNSVTAAVSLGCVFIALGALVTPGLTDLLLRGLEFRRTAALLGFVCLLPAVAAAFTPAAAFGDAGRGGDAAAILTDHRLWLAAAVFLCYAPLEGAVSVWTTTYLTDMGHGERRAAWLLSGFWACFLLARLGAAWLQHWWEAYPYLDKFLLVLALATGAAVVGNLAGSARAGSARGWLLLLGALLGPVFPTLVGLLFEVFREGQGRGIAYGALFAAGSVGSLLLSPLVGARARARSVQAALHIPMVVGLLAATAALAFSLTVGIPTK